MSVSKKLGGFGAGLALTAVLAVSPASAQGRANCDTYAKIAQVQADANQKYNCGYRGGVWETDSRPHFGWCMINKRYAMLDELRYRAQELQKCFNTLGDYDEEGGDRNYQRRH